MITGKKQERIALHTKRLPVTQSFTSTVYTVIHLAQAPFDTIYKDRSVYQTKKKSLQECRSVWLLSK